MPSTVTIPPGTFNPSGIPPEKPAGISDEEWVRILNQLRTQDFYDSNPELRNIVPKAPGGRMPVGGTPGGPAPVPALPASQVPAQSAMGLPGQVAAQGASQAVAPVASHATSLLSSWLSPQVLIPAAAGVAGTVIQSNAANKATDAQTEAADKSLALTEKMYEQDRADYTPYRNLGAYSLSQLGHLVGMPADFGTKAVEGATTATPAPHVSTIPPNTLGGRTLAALEPQREQAVASAMASPELQTLRDLGATRQTASSFVRMRAPDGEEADVAAHEVPIFERAGAMRLS